MTSQNEKIDTAGWLWKEGKGKLRVWQKRYFVLNVNKSGNAQLSWFLNIKAKKPQNAVLASDLIVEVQGSEQGILGEEYFFTLKSKAKTWILKSIGVHHGRDWVVKLQQAGARVRYPEGVTDVNIDWRECVLHLSNSTRKYFRCVRFENSTQPWTLEQNIDDKRRVGILSDRTIPLKVTLSDRSCVGSIRPTVIDSATGESVYFKELLEAPRKIDGLHVTIFIKLEDIKANGNPLYIGAQHGDTPCVTCAVLTADVRSANMEIKGVPSNGASTATTTSTSSSSNVSAADAATASRKAASLLQREQDKKLKQQQLAQQRLVDEHAHNAPASMAPSPLAPPPSLGNDSEKQRQKEEEEEQRRMKEQEEAARRQKEADETKRKAREAAEAKRKAQEEEATRRAQEQEATRKTEEEAVKRRQQQEEDERRAAKEKAELAEKQRREEEERVAKQAQEQQATTNKSTNDDVIGRCIAMFDFEALKPSHLSFKKDDIIEITSKNPSAWWRGKIGDKFGKFPSNYTRPYESTPENVAATPLAIEPFKAIAKYAWDSDNPSDLNFKVGDVITVVSKVNDQWWYGTLGEQSGKMPKNRLARIDENGDTKTVANDTKPVVSPRHAVERLDSTVHLTKNNSDKPAPPAGAPPPTNNDNCDVTKAEAGDGLLKLQLDQTFLERVTMSDDRKYFRCTFEGASTKSGEWSIRSASDTNAGHAFTALCSQPIPIGITCGRDGRRDCKLRLFSSDRKLERGKDWKIEAQTYRQTKHADITTLFISVVEPSRDLLKLSASLADQTLDLKFKAMAARRSSKPVNSPSSTKRGGSRSHKSKSSSNAVLENGRRLLARRPANVGSLTDAEFVSVLVAAHHENVSPPLLEAFTDALVDRLAIAEAAARPGQPSDAPPLRAALRLHVGLTENDSSATIDKFLAVAVEMAK